MITLPEVLKLRKSSNAPYNHDEYTIWLYNKIIDSIIQQPQLKPRIFVEIEEGVINSVIANMDMEVSITDIDDQMYDKDSSWFVYHRAKPDCIVSDEQFENELLEEEAAEAKVNMKLLPK